jgi:hypothetical protein
MSEQLRMITLILSILGIGIWVLRVVHKPRLLRYAIVLFVFLASTTLRYVVIYLVGYEAVSAGGAYNQLFNAWTTATNLYLVLVIFLAGVFTWKD